MFTDDIEDVPQEKAEYKKKWSKMKKQQRRGQSLGESEAYVARGRAECIEGQSVCFQYALCTDADYL